MLAFIARILESQDESGGLQIGDLIIHLLRQAGETVLPVLPQLLQAMISRMTTATTATFLQVRSQIIYIVVALIYSQSLVIPFAFLINNQPDTVLSLLETININDRSGLHILIQTWCENAETFQGFWPSRVSTLALTKLFASGRPSLQNLMVKGDLIIKPETKNSEYEFISWRRMVLSAAAIMTRSKTKKSEDDALHPSIS